MNKIKIALIGMLITTFAACGGVTSSEDPSEGSGDPSTSNSSETQEELASKNLTELCEGYFVCEGPNIEKFGDRLVKIQEACYLGDRLINADGTGDGGVYFTWEEGAYKVSLTWQGDASSFEVCESYEPTCYQDSNFCNKGKPGKETNCYRCNFDEKEIEEPEVEEEEPSCQGLADSCSWRSPGYCSSQRGCYLGTHFLPGGGSELRCKGSPHSCSSMYSEDSCGNHDGCDWK